MLEFLILIKSDANYVFFDYLKFSKGLYAFAKAYPEIYSNNKTLSQNHVTQYPSECEIFMLGISTVCSCCLKYIL